MDKILKNIDFDEQCHSLREIMKDFSLPAVVKAESQCLLSGKKTIQPGNIITVHGKKSVDILKGKDTKGRIVHLLTVCPYQVQLALPEAERITFKSLKELCEKEQRPKFVEITVDKTNELDAVKNGDRLKVLLVEKGTTGPLFMHFRNEKGKHVRLPVGLQASFTACPPDGKEYFISEIANINKTPLALFIQFVPCDDNALAEVYNSLGVIEIIEQYSVELIFATILDGGKLHCAVCPSSIDLKGQLPKTEAYESIRTTILETVDVEKFNAIVGSVSPLEWDPNIMISFEKVFPKKKSKDKVKKKDEQARLSMLTGSDDNLSDKEKKNKRFTLFKEEQTKKEKEGNGKKEKKDKKMDPEKRKSKDDKLDNKSTEVEIAEEQQSTGLVEDGANKLTGVAINTENDIKEIENGKSASEEEHNIKKKHKDDKKKWKFEFKAKFAGNEKKHKKKKAGHEATCEVEPNPAAEVSGDNMSSVPSSPSSPTCDPTTEDDYELPVTGDKNATEQGIVESPAQDKSKSSTLISRTWKKMKKRRRALSVSRVHRPEDARSKLNKQKTIDNSDILNDNDCPPPLMESDYGEDLYEQIPGEFLSQDIYEEAVRAYSAYETAVPLSTGTSSSIEATDSGFDENDQKALDVLKQLSAPPPLPGNHPRMQSAPLPRRGSSVKSNITRASIDSEGFRRFYESLKMSEAELRSWGPDEIEKGLADLKLGKHIRKFNESQIDGNLLFDLDEAVLRDLGLSLFEARKLRKFVFGWRPDSLRASDYYEKYDRSSKNPSHWSMNFVADIISKDLGMNDFAKFCTENQVNGDLLRDIVVDDELLKTLLKGIDMRLNSVKLKNYVLDGWRPPKKKSSGMYDIDADKMGAKRITGSSVDNTVSTSPYEEPVSPAFFKGRNFDRMQETEKTESPSVTSSRDNTTELPSPTRLVQDKPGARKTSLEELKMVGSSGGVNSLMKKYEQKSQTMGNSPRKGHVNKPQSTSGSHTGIGQRTSSDAPFVANMKKKFADRQ